jgi:hypothetical protein
LVWPESGRAEFWQRRIQQRSTGDGVPTIAIKKSTHHWKSPDLVEVSHPAIAKDMSTGSKTMTSCTITTAAGANGDPTSGQNGDVRSRRYA